MQRPGHLAPYGVLGITVLFWGLSFIVSKIALESFTPFSLIFIRFSLAACFFMAVMGYRGFPSLSVKDHAAIFLTALFQPGLYFTFETTGLQYTSASKASLIVAIIPVAVLGLSILFLGERSTWRTLIGIGLSLVGVALLIWGDPRSGWRLDGPMLGDLLIFGAVISMALYTVMMKRMARTCSVLDLTGLQMSYGALLFAPAFFWTLPQVEVMAIKTSALAALVGLVLFATIGAFFCYNYALARLSAPRTAIFLNCVPVVTTIGAWAVLAERLTALQFGGGMLVLFSVYLANTSGKTRLGPELKKVFNAWLYTPNR